MIDTLSRACLPLSMTYTRTYVRGICPKCGTEMHLYGEYNLVEQTCTGCFAVWTITFKDCPGGEPEWSRDGELFIAPTDMSVIIKDGPFQKEQE